MPFKPSWCILAAYRPPGRDTLYIAETTMAIIPEPSARPHRVKLEISALSSYARGGCIGWRHGYGSTMLMLWLTGHLAQPIDLSAPRLAFTLVAKAPVI